MYNWENKQCFFYREITLTHQSVNSILLGHSDQVGSPTSLDRDSVRAAGTGAAAFRICESWP